MNLLSFVFLFLLLFAFSSASFSARSRAFARAAKEHNMQAELASKKYLTLQTKWYLSQSVRKAAPKTSAPVSKSPRPKTRPKRTGPYPFCAKCNVLPLLEDPTSPMHAVVLSLVEQIFTHRSFQGGSFTQPSVFLEEFCRCAALQKEEGAPLFLEKLLFAPEEQVRYYHLLRSQEKSPSLLDLCHAGTQNSICLPCCSREMLTALFGSVVAHKLWQTKEDPSERLVLSRGHIEQLLSEEGRSLHPTLWEHFRYKHRHSEDALETITAKTGGRKASFVLPKKPKKPRKNRQLGRPEKGSKSP
ncbi:MAG: hypothetical protein AAGF04_04495 [Chlamydiota bacterium]